MRREILPRFCPDGLKIFSLEICLSSPPPMSKAPLLRAPLSHLSILLLHTLRVAHNRLRRRCTCRETSCRNFNAVRTIRSASITDGVTKSHNEILDGSRRLCPGANAANASIKDRRGRNRRARRLCPGRTPSTAPGRFLTRSNFQPPPRLQASQ